MDDWKLSILAIFVAPLFAYFILYPIFEINILFKILIFIYLGIGFVFSVSLTYIINYGDLKLNFISIIDVISCTILWIPILLWFAISNLYLEINE